jgi:hypothetical protein
MRSKNAAKELVRLNSPVRLCHDHSHNDITLNFAFQTSLCLWIDCEFVLLHSVALMMGLAKWAYEVKLVDGPSTNLLLKLVHSHLVLGTLVLSPLTPCMLDIYRTYTPTYHEHFMLS